jgi:hypothetical protein
VLFEYELPSHAQAVAITDIAQFGLRRSAIVDLITAITAFVARPLSEIDPQSFAYTAELADAAGDRLDLNFGPRRDVVTATNGIACLVEIGRSAFSARMVFRTDVTCLERLAAELDRVLLVELRDG